jgi:hypothetical protein
VNFGGVAGWLSVVEVGGRIVVGRQVRWLA